MKSCIICKIEKPLTEFYVHKQMGDGHLNKCKSCCKSQSKEREEKLRASPEWVDNEKARAREKYYRLDYKEKHKPTYENKKAIIERYKKAHPEKLKAKLAADSIKNKIKGTNLHHWSYNEDHLRDVIELRERLHYLAHRYMIYDQERFMYRTLNGELLDTKERHYNYILNIFRTRRN